MQGQLTIPTQSLDEAIPSPDLTTYPLLIMNLSGGVDSQAALDELHRRATAAGVADRIVAVHADLGPMEWPGAKELAAEHAAHYGVRFEVVRREVNGQAQTLLDYIQARGMFPDATRRYCTSSFKRDPIRTLITRLVTEQRDAGAADPVRVLNVMGIRAEESPARRMRPAFRHDGGKTCLCPPCRTLPREDRPAGTSNTRRHVDEWMVIHHWSKAHAWERVAQAGTRAHPAYGRLPRLSCKFCVLASRSALVEAARMDPEGARQYAEVEERIGHRFRQDLPMARIIELAAAAPARGPVEDWLA